jgi:hypothetical protein
MPAWWQAQKKSRKRKAENEDEESDVRLPAGRSGLPHEAALSWLLITND